MFNTKICIYIYIYIYVYVYSCHGGCREGGRQARRREHVSGVDVSLAHFIKFKHGLY